MVDWERFAKLNNMTPDEFKHEIFTVCMVLGEMEIDKAEEDGFLRVRQNGLELTIRKLDNEEY